MSYWNDLSHHLDLSDNWMAHPLVRPRLNQRVTGDAAIWPTQWLKRFFPAPAKRAASIGCGVGNLERDLLRNDVVESITGIELSANCITTAREEAKKEQLNERVAYVEGDGRAWLESAEQLDAIFFHSSLHHIDDVPSMLDLVASKLRPNGILYVDEYAGPSRHQWRLHHTILWNVIYYTLPQSVRRVRRIRPPINEEDPTEAIDSGRIVKSVEERFEILARRDYGGTLLSVLYPNLRLDSGEVLNETVSYLLDLEEAWLRHPRMAPEPSYYSVIVARRR